MSKQTIWYHTNRVVLCLVVLSILAKHFDKVN